MSSPFPAYRDSGIEWLPRIPAHWSSERLATLFSQAAEAGNDELPVLSVSIHSGVTDAEEAGVIKPFDPEQGKRNAKYVPAWA